MKQRKELLYLCESRPNHPSAFCALTAFHQSPFCLERGHSLPEGVIAEGGKPNINGPVLWYVI